MDDVILTENVNIWRIAPGNKNIYKDVWELFKKESYIAIGFTQLFGEKDFNEFNSISEIKSYVDENSHAPKMIWDFTKTMKQGDIVVVNYGRSEVAGIGIIDSDYISPSNSEFLNDFGLIHSRKVRWLITESFKVKNNFFIRDTLNQLKPKKWNEIISFYARNNEKFCKDLIKYLFNLFLDEFKNTPEGIEHFNRYDEQSQNLKENFEIIKTRFNNGREITENVWNNLISPQGMFSTYNNPYTFFEKTYGLSKTEMDKVANLFFNTLNSLLDNKSDLIAQKNILSDFVNNELSKGFKTGLFTPTLYLIDDYFYVINRKTIDTVKLLSNLVDFNINITNELLDYPDNNKLLHEFLNVLSGYVLDLRDFRIFDEFSHWACSSKLGNYAHDKSLPLVGFKSNGSEDDGDELQIPVKITPDMIDLEGIKVEHNVLLKICASLNAGKNIILTGPPGTAKTELAIKIAESANEFISGYTLTTATADWTTFDTLGGFMPNSGGELEFREGQFLNAIKNNEWLIIDEINRADIDKSFGQLFTVLSNQKVELPYKTKVKNKNISPDDENYEVKEEYVKIVPNDEEVNSYYDDSSAMYNVGKSWRIIATMNVYDKDSLFDMSYAFMRRFSFIDVGLPEKDDFEELIDEWCENIKDYADNLKILLNLNEYRQLGPAIFKDMINYIEERTNLDDSLDVLDEAIISYIIPQFEGLDTDELLEILKFFDEKGMCSEDIKNKIKGMCF